MSVIVTGMIKIALDALAFHTATRAALQAAQDGDLTGSGLHLIFLPDVLTQHL